ncbi:MAG: DNA polymerase III subunit delta [Solirubrobacterales bacterium]
MAEIKPAYLIAGDDEAKIARARQRLRARAERDGGPGALELFEAGEGRRAPDADALLGSLNAISLTASHRFLLADGIEGWGKRDAEAVAEALGSVPPDTTVVLIAHGKPPAPLKKAVEKTGGEVLAYDAPRERELPRQLVGQAADLGFTLDLEAARMLVARLGPRSLRLRNELERLALWSGGGRVGPEEIQETIADTSEEAIWSLADAIVAGDEAETLRVAESLVAQGEALPRIVYSLAPRLRQALRASRELEAGRSPKDVASGLSMHPYAAKLLVQRVRGRSPADIDRAIRAVADLEVDSRGGSDYEGGVALTLALKAAV